MFSVQQEVAGTSCRLGRILNGSKELLTPAFVVNSVRGSIPHLTPDLAAEVTALRSLNVPLADCATLIPVMKKLTMSGVLPDETPYHSMLQLEESKSVVLSVRNPLTNLQHLGVNANVSDEQSNRMITFDNKGGLAIPSESGLLKVTGTEFLQNIDILRPDMVFLGIEEGTVTYSNSRNEKVMRKAIELSDTLLNLYNDVFSAKYQPFIFVPVEGGNFMKKRYRHARIMSCKGGPLWRKLEEPNPEDATAMKLYKDKITNEGIDVTRPADGFVIGGLGSASSPAELSEMIQNSINGLDKTKPRAANIVGEPIDVVHLVKNGVDIITTSYPMLMAEAGLAITIPITDAELASVVDTVEEKETDDMSTTKESSLVSNVFEQPELANQYINLRNYKYREDAKPIDETCSCYACRHHTRSYISHLLNAHEMLAEVLLMIHNTHQYGLLFNQLRTKMTAEPHVFEAYTNNLLKVYKPHGSLLNMDGRRKIQGRKKITANEDEE